MYVCLIAYPWVHSAPFIVTLSIVVSVALVYAIVQANLWSITLVTALYHRVTHERLLEFLRSGREYKASDWAPSGAPSGHSAADASRGETVARRDLERDFPGMDAGTADGLEELRSLIGRPRLFGRACGYCGAPHAPIICPACQRIQFGDLMHENLRPHMPDWNWSLAVFLGRYRWEVMLATVPASIGGMIGLTHVALTEQREMNLTRTQKVESEADKFIGAALSFRWALAALEARCGSELSSQFCSGLYATLNENYMTFSWYGDPLIESLGRAVCFDEVRSWWLSERQRYACAYLEGGRAAPVDVVDDAFRVYNEALNSSAATDEARRVAAINLYYKGRKVGCIVSALRWDTRPNENDRGCLTLLRDDWADIDSVPTCGGGAAGAEWGCWDMKP